MTQDEIHQETERLQRLGHRFSVLHLTAFGPEGGWIFLMECDCEGDDQTRPCPELVAGREGRN